MDDSSSLPQQVAMREIAEAAGVSPMTVSRALRGVGGVSEELAGRIRELAEKMGYRPNPLVAALVRSRRQGAMVHGNLTLAWWGDTRAYRSRESLPTRDTFTAFLDGACKGAEARGFRVEVFNHQAGQLKDLIRIIRVRGIRGLLVGPGGWRDFPDNNIPELEGVHVVQLGRSRGNLHYDRVVVDAFQTMASCIQRLVDAGAKKIGYVDSVSHQMRSENRLLGSYFIYANANGTFPLLTDARDPEKDCYFKDYLKHLAPDALIMGARSFLEPIEENSPGIPLLCLNSQGLPDWISGFSHPSERIGMEASRMLIDKILGPPNLSFPGRSVVIQGQWHEGITHRAGWSR